MKKFTYIIAIIILSYGCSYKVESTDLLQLAEGIDHTFRNKDYGSLESLYQDSTSFWTESEQNNLQTIKKLFESEITQIRVDTSSMNILGKSYHIQLYYKMNNEFYSIVANCSKDSSTQKYEIYSMSVNNINEKCTSYLETPYCPKYRIDIKRIIWNTDYHGKTFESGSVELQNKLDHDINYIKLRVILKHGKKSWNQETFLNQTIESYKHIYQGDIVKIEIPGMNDYYTGFEIKEDELTFTSELIEVKPKPVSHWCKTKSDLIQTPN